MPAPIPLALGLVRSDPNALPAERSRTRIGFAGFAFQEGYALIEVFEMTGWSVRDDASLTALRDRAEWCGVRTLIVADDVPARALDAAVAGNTMVALVVPAVLVTARARLPVRP